MAEPDENPATVAGVGVALDELSGLEPVEAFGDPARRQHHRVLQVAHVDRVGAGPPAQRGKHVEVGHREPELGKPLLAPAGDVLRQAQDATGDR